MNTSIQNTNFDIINPESKLNTIDNLKLISDKEEIKENKEKKKRRRK